MFRYGLIALIVYVIFKLLQVPLASMVVGMCALAARGDCRKCVTNSGILKYREPRAVTAGIEWANEQPGSLGG